MKPTRWGIYDTRDNCWLGDDNGPKLFGADDVVNGQVLGEEGAELLARTAEKVVTYCGRYEGSSVSEFHMREIAAGRIPPWSQKSVAVCEECREMAGIE